MKFTFTSQFVGFGSPTSTLEFEADQIEDVINYFSQFLKGSGYHFDGYLDIVPNDEDEQELHEWYQDKAADQEFPPEMFESQDVMTMPGTMGGAKVVFGDPIQSVTSLNEKCKVCNLTRQQLGDHHCYDTRCGFK